MQRINVVGTSGTGKSTFAKKLAEKLGYPYTQLDQLFWEPNWVQASDEDFRNRIEQATSKPNWVLDGNYSRTEPYKWNNVTDVIWLDYPFPLTMWRAIKRATHRIYSNKEIWPGTNNKETIRKTFFSHDSILLWTMTSYRSVRRKYAEKISDPAISHIRFTRFRTPREAESFLASI